MKGRQHVQNVLYAIVIGSMITWLLVGCGKLDDDNRPTAPAVSSTAPFAYEEAPQTEPAEPDTLPPVSGDVLISDTLKNGQSTGEVSGGTFTPQGVQLHGGNGFIHYSIPTTPSGYIEFNAQGFIPGELHGGTEYKAVLFTMWSGSEGYSYENAAYIFELRKYGYIQGRPDASDAFFFKIKSQGVWEEGHFHVLSWDAGATYRIRIEWGNGQTRAFRNGSLVATGSYHGQFAPSNHQIQIGAQPLRQRVSPHNLLISDVVVGRL
ncbi:hypothetical protein GF339_03445 [candidate division KSB3 bacterium]|uniref:Uncharacterized protein n=1 Tax=candidate division KSB3 bacterium TaxID=2044937 RepID=A0A9D5JSU2_9BACT|nr:hypothetical protein [candidate division KSB3 bacterium]MBD3323612.1 hypothetical protein [candidate division KSB3 bacterium]